MAEEVEPVNGRRPGRRHRKKMDQLVCENIEYDSAVYLFPYNKI